MISIPNIILVPYGVDSWSVGDIGIKRLSDGTIRPDAPFPCTMIDTTGRKPLRLNSEALNIAPNLNARPDATPLSVISDHLRSLCRTWDQLSLRFIDGYFVHLTNMLGVHRETIVEKLAPFAGLYAAEDWIFSALKPLPRAHIYAPRNNGTTWETEDFVQVDFAFWLGERMVAVLSRPGTLTPARATQRLARLEQADVTMVHFAADDLVKEPTVLFNRIIGDFGALIGSADIVPSSPFRPEIPRQ
jgi:hypothetical protein